MQTRTYADLFELVSALCGVTFATIEEPRIRALMNRRAVRAFKSSNYWTRFINIGEERTVYGGCIPFFQAGKNTIDSFLRIFAYAPYRTNGSQEYQYAVGQSGAELVSGNIVPTSAFVVYKSAISFSTAAGATSSSLTSSSLIPEEWFEYMAHGTYADYLRAEGQQEKAAVADAEASEILLDELMKIDEQHTQTIISKRIFTNMNMQSREGGGGAMGASSGSGDQVLFPPITSGDTWGGFTWEITSVEAGNTDYLGTLTLARFELKDPYGAVALLLTSPTQITLNNTAANLWSVTINPLTITLAANIYTYGLETTDSITGVKTQLVGTLTVNVDPVI